MDAFIDKLGRIGIWCSQNKYLSAIKNAFQNFMPATIAGSISVLWINVLVNEETGLGALWKPIMILEGLNPIFSAIQYATISCIAIGIVMLVAQEIGEANGETGAYPAILGFISWLLITPTHFGIENLMVKTAEFNQYGEYIIKPLNDFVHLPEGASVIEFNGLLSSYTGATGLFTALIIGIVSMEIYGKLRKMEILKIKMPDQILPGVTRAFEALIPSFIMLVIIGGVGHCLHWATGMYTNDLISTYIQEPLTSIFTESLLAVMLMYVLISLFWLVGIHGDNMMAAMKETLLKPALYYNTALFNQNAKTGYKTFNLTMVEMFAEWGGSGVTLGLVIAIFIFGKREDNRAIATLSVVPSLFNINETVTFGIPLVLNPILGVPFVLAPVACIALGSFLIKLGFCPPIVVEVPWTVPPLFFGFFATGGKIMGAASQLIAIILSTVIYIPFLIAYEKFQNKQASKLE